MFRNRKNQENRIQKQEKTGPKNANRKNIGKNRKTNILGSALQSCVKCVFTSYFFPIFDSYFFPYFFPKINIFNFYRNSRKLCIITLEGTHRITSTEHRNMRCKMAHPDIKKTLNRTIPLVKIMTKNASYRGWLRNPAPPWMVQTCRNPLNNGK